MDGIRFTSVDLQLPKRDSLVFAPQDGYNIYLALNRYLENAFIKEHCRERCLTKQLHLFISFAFTIIYISTCKIQ